MVVVVVVVVDVFVMGDVGVCAVVLEVLCSDGTNVVVVATDDVVAFVVCVVVAGVVVVVSVVFVVGEAG